MSFAILYSFRRCPYAMRARLALASAGITVVLREILLRDKPSELIVASPKATVPVLVNGTDVIDESLDIMLWALSQNDPKGWLNMPDAGHALIQRSDTQFKPELDAYKYNRNEAARERASAFLRELDNRLSQSAYLFGPAPTLADMAIITFVRQFALVNKDWFDAQGWRNLLHWLESFLETQLFSTIMQKHQIWQAGDPPTLLPQP